MAHSRNPRGSDARSARVGLRTLRIVLGDQLDPEAPGLRELDPLRDAVWMAECHEETTHVWCHKLRIAAFLSAMRHFRDALQARGQRVIYRELPADPARDEGPGFAALLARDLARLRPQRLVVTRPGDQRVERALREAAAGADLALEIEEDGHFLDTPADFAEWASGRKDLVLETYYRHMRRRYDVLMDKDGPLGGSFNYDAHNRERFPKEGPAGLRPPRGFAPDATTRRVMRLVERRFAGHPGSLEAFDLPVTPEQARAALADFVRHRLADFGRYQDALWEGEPFLFHSRLSFALNTKLLDPRRCLEAALEALQSGSAPLASVEGFVRQILGWREFVRGIYTLHMPDYAEGNALACRDRPLPALFWNGESEMRCVADAMESVLRHGYAHHIQRLMVLGLYAQLLGVHPLRFHQWHMALYVDAVDWVSLPNALGMSQWGDGGVVGTKPYCATGAYVDRMSNHCGGCRFDPRRALGREACPLTTLYWDFLARHERRFRSNRRMALQLKNLERKDAAELAAIRRQARRHRREAFATAAT